MLFGSSMTLGRDTQHQPFAGAAGEASQDSSFGQMQRKQERTKRQRRAAAVIDLASQSSNEIQSPSASLGALLAGKDRAFAVGDVLGTQPTNHLQPAAAAEATGQAGAAAAGQKRFWDASPGDDVALVSSTTPTPQLLWGSTRPRMRATRPSSAAAAAAAAGSPIVILDDDTPAALDNNMRQQLHLQSPPSTGIQGNRRKSTPVRPLSIAPNPSNPHAAAAQAAAPAPRRRLIAQRMQAAAARQPAQVAQEAQRRSSNSSGSSAEQVDVVADAALARKLAQEDEDRLLAQRLMQEEQSAARARLAANRYEMEAVHAAAAAAAGAAAAAAGRPREGGRAAFPAPPSFLFPGFPGLDPADAARMQAPGVQAGDAQQQLQGSSHPGQRAFDAGQAMAHMLLSLPMPRWRAPWGSGGARRGLPPGLVQMREAVLGMQRAGLPPHLLFSDRDFTADDYDLLCRLDETVENRKGASAATIDAMPTQTVPQGGLPGAAAGERLSCAVCLEEFVEGAELRCLPCLHKFHKGCIDTWLRQKSACPVCNRDCA